MSRPLHIVQAAAFPFPSPQGSQVYVQGMARALARRGHRVTVACYAHGVGQPDSIYDVVRTPAVPGYGNLRAGPDLVKPVLDLALAARLARLRADIVHAHNYEAPVAAALARLRTGTPIVYCAHNTMAEELHTYFEGRIARSVARRAGRLLDRTVPRLADHAQAISPAAVRTLQALGCSHVSMVPPGIDPDELPMTVPAALPPGPWVVYAGNPDAYQDLDVLFDAMARVPGARLLMVSASSLAAWRARGLPGLHTVETDDFAVVRSLLAAADIAALPRTRCTGYPIKLLNYLGMGLPTVAAQGSAQPLPGVVAVPDRDAAAFADAVSALLEHPERRARLAADARAHVLQHCTWDARAAELEALYRSVLSR
ncbi:MAG: glycosyltransferase family 4 protein [Alphaproteobacteria bacterium]|nr:glycosyltransferase family 4 protein [Alphaproteobacteria bacterium]